jgi:hypothetical protein
VPRWQDFLALLLVLAAIATVLVPPRPALDPATSREEAVSGTIAAMLKVSGLACSRGERRLFADVGFRWEAVNGCTSRAANGAGKTSLMRAAGGPGAGRCRRDPLARRAGPFRRVSAAK